MYVSPSGGGLVAELVGPGLHLAQAGPVGVDVGDRPGGAGVGAGRLAAAQVAFLDLAGLLSARDIKNTALNLNFDMVGSPNAAYFVYDGDGDALGVAGPNGSALIESVFTSFFTSAGSASVPTDFDGRSDYFAFINAGIPAGGLFTGAEGIMSDAEAELFTGVAGEPYDSCYHAACDDIDNLNGPALDIMSDAIAHATLTFAQTTSAVNGTSKGKGKGTVDWQFKGAKALR
jgi:Zn-dependent M28 family amino/carboxypeptidase